MARAQTSAANFGHGIMYSIPMTRVGKRVKQRLAVCNNGAFCVMCNSRCSSAKILFSNFFGKKVLLFAMIESIKRGWYQKKYVIATAVAFDHRFVVRI